MVIFRRANHDEKFGAIQVGATELPEGATDGVDHARRHID